MLEKINGKTISIINLIFIGLMNVCLILRFFLGGGEDVAYVTEDEEIIVGDVVVGVGGTPTFLFLIQLLSTVAFSILLVLAELKKAEGMMGYIALFKSKSGRGVVLLMLALPTTNFHNWFIAIVAILTVLVAILNILIGFSEPPLTL